MEQTKLMRTKRAFVIHVQKYIMQVKQTQTLLPCLLELNYSRCLVNTEPPGGGSGN